MDSKLKYIQKNRNDFNTVKAIEPVINGTEFAEAGRCFSPVLQLSTSTMVTTLSFTVYI